MNPSLSFATLCHTFYLAHDLAHPSGFLRLLSNNFGPVFCPSGLNSFAADFTSAWLPFVGFASAAPKFFHVFRNCQGHVGFGFVFADAHNSSFLAPESLLRAFVRFDLATFNPISAKKNGNGSGGGTEEPAA